MVWELELTLQQLQNELASVSQKDDDDKAGSGALSQNFINQAARFIESSLHDIPLNTTLPRSLPDALLSYINNRHIRQQIIEVSARTRSDPATFQRSTLGPSMPTGRWIRHQIASEESPSIWTKLKHGQAAYPNAKSRHQTDRPDVRSIVRATFLELAVNSLADEFNLHPKAGDAAAFLMGGAYQRAREDLFAKWEQVQSVRFIRNLYLKDTLRNAIHATNATTKTGFERLVSGRLRDIERNWHPTDLWKFLQDSTPYYRAREETKKKVRSMVEEARQKMSEDKARLYEPHYIDGLAYFDDYFPGNAQASLNTPRAQLLTEAVTKGKMFWPLLSASHTTVRSYSAIQSLIPVGGVLLRRLPDRVQDGMDIVDMSWMKWDEKPRLSFHGRTGSVIETEPLDRATIHLALVYAADARPLAVTIVCRSDCLARRVYLHPALEDTELGRRVIELDRLTFDTLNIPNSEAGTRFCDWKSTLNNQLRTYRWAWAIRLDELAPHGGDRRANPLGETLWGVLRSLAKDADGKPGANVSTLEHLRKKPRFFDENLIEHVETCLRGPVSEECIRQEVRRQRGTYAADTAFRWAAPPPRKIAFRSGVRESGFGLDPEFEFAKEAGDNAALPFYFVVEAALVGKPWFREKEGKWFEPDIGTMTGGNGGSPYRLDLEGLLEREIASRLSDDQSLSKTSRRVAQFTLLQRTFRSALNGQLGADFPLEKLVYLGRDTWSPGIRKAPTDRWIITSGAEIDQGLPSYCTAGI